MQNVIVVPSEQVPPELRAWLAAEGAERRLVELIALPDGALALRALPGTDAGLVERALITMTKYREALMNLT
jgi:hypothetical protein